MGFTYTPREQKVSKHLSIPLRLEKLADEHKINLSAFLTEHLEGHFKGKGPKGTGKDAKAEEERRRKEFLSRVLHWRTEWRKELCKPPKQKDYKVRARGVNDLHDNFGIDWMDAKELIDGVKDP